MQMASPKPPMPPVTSAMRGIFNAMPYSSSCCRLPNRRARGHVHRGRCAAKRIRRRNVGRAASTTARTRRQRW
jgi:hypothetical protein